MVDIYLDAADLASIDKFIDKVEGVTTNPSIMKKAGITNYREFASHVLARVKGKPVSFEVLSDDWDEMYSQACEICSWGDNVYAKIPITNTKGEMSIDLIDSLEDKRINITAVMTQDQVDALYDVVWSHHIVSIFMGRIFDTCQQGPFILAGFRAKMLWASPRQVGDVFMAGKLGFDIITMTPDLIAKLPLRGKDLKQYSLETVQQFYNDGRGIEF
jgi:transaldolase